MLCLVHLHWVLEGAVHLPIFKVLIHIERIHPTLNLRVDLEHVLLSSAGADASMDPEG